MAQHAVDSAKSRDTLCIGKAIFRVCLHCLAGFIPTLNRFLVIGSILPMLCLDLQHLDVKRCVRNRRIIKQSFSPWRVLHENFLQRCPRSMVYSQRDRVSPLPLL